MTKLVVIAMKFRVTNRVFTAHCGGPINLYGEPLTSSSCYKPPGRRFPGARLKFNSGTVLVFRNGKLVINGCGTDGRLLETILEFEALTGVTISVPELRNIVGCVKSKVSIDLAFFCSVCSPEPVEYTPELHPGAFLRIDNVSVIVYHTGAVIFTGSRSEEQFDAISQRIKTLINKYKSKANNRNEFYRNHYG